MQTIEKVFKDGYNYLDEMVNFQRSSIYHTLGFRRLKISRILLPSSDASTLSINTNAIGLFL
jgi:hypothetical protein